MKAITIYGDYQCDGSEDLILVDGSAGSVNIQLVAENTKKLCIRQLPVGNVAITVTAPSGQSLDYQPSWIVYNLAVIFEADPNGDYFFFDYQ